ncbi:MAG: SgcJ/EcaC family oxidoreductase [Sphingobacteriales bacterium]|nr:MAG: SgcJ/EcaC family oxidoreductase [Sphingobacteriales bacterium]
MRNDEEQIEAVFANLAKAWNNADVELFGSLFTEDCDYVTFNGQHIKGRKENMEAHRKLWNGILLGSELIGDTQTIRFPAENLAIVHATGSVKLRWQKKAPKGRKSINTNVLIKQNGEWKITAFHNCRIVNPNILQKFFTKLFEK